MTAPTWLASARGVVVNCQHAEVDGMLLDLFTAGHLVAVWEALSPANRERFAAMSLPAAVSLMWKLLERQGKR